MKDLSHRKSAARLHIVNPDGTAAANTKITVKQTSSEFLFGCGAFDSVAMFAVPDEALKNKFRERMEKWATLFNFATLPFYWGTYEPVEGQPQIENRRQAAEWLTSRGIKVKGHPLCWHTVCADWLMQYDNETILKKQLERIDRDVTAFKGQIDMWDVINEVVIMPVFDKYDNAVTRICNEKGQIGLVKAVFDEARQMNPDATLLINDFNTSKAYEDLLDRILDAGVVPSAIGIQSHQHQGYWGTDKIYDVLERFGRFNIPIHFTENTLISGDLMPAYIEDLNDWQVDEWPSTPEGEARQANEIAEMYSILFADKNVQAITSWDYTDDCWLNAPAGIVRKDNSSKPSFDKLMSLIHGEWETNLTLTTDSEGNISFEGFKGSYEISSDKGSAKIDLSTDKNTELKLS